MSTTINYASTPMSGACTLTTGSTSRTSPTNVGVLYDGTSTSGAMVERVTIMPLATTSNSVIRIWKYDGSTYHLIIEIALAAQTVSTGAAVSFQTLQAVDYPGWIPISVPAGWKLCATVNDTQTGVKLVVEGGSF